MTAKPLNDLLNWRYATKKMDPSKTVPQDKVDVIIEAIRMAPTSSGTQPFELIVVTTPDVRSKIAEAPADRLRSPMGLISWSLRRGTTKPPTASTTWSI